MGKKRIKKRKSINRSKRSSGGRRVPPGTIRLTTPEGDEIVLATARYRHTALEDILSILRQADDLILDAYLDRHSAHDEVPKDVADKLQQMATSDPDDTVRRAVAKFMREPWAQART